MNTLVIPDLDDDTFARLRDEAAGHGRSEAEEARWILANNLKRTAAPRGATETLADPCARSSRRSGAKTSRMCACAVAARLRISLEMTTPLGPCNMPPLWKAPIRARRWRCLPTCLRK